MSGGSEIKTWNLVRFAKSIGRRHAQQGFMWLPSAGLYGASLVLLGIYFSDWKLVGKYIPYYGSRRQLQDE